MPLDLTDRLILVAGASGRLGRVVVRHLTEAGATIAALDRSEPDDLPSGVRFYGTDLTDEQEVTRTFESIGTDLGTPWGLIHTVGMWDGGPLGETSLDAWRRMMDVNLTSAFLSIRAFVRHTTEGRIVGIASRQGADRAPEQQAAYAASKAGVIRLLEATSAEQPGLACVAIAPSTILFGDEGTDARGVPVEAIADLCSRLCGDAGAVHDGAVLRAYGDG